MLDEGQEEHQGEAQQAHQQALVRRASKALLKQVEETRRKYAAEVEGLKGELQALARQAARERRDADLASVTAAAAKKAALQATEELERLNGDVQRARSTLAQAARCGVKQRWLGGSPPLSCSCSSSTEQHAHTRSPASHSLRIADARPWSP